jgi:hypothetical protein
MPQAYSDPSRESDDHALPDLEIFQLTAAEIAAQDEELVSEYMKRREFRLAGFNYRDREKMIDAIIEEEKITGGWFYWYCFPGCLPDSEMIGPFKTYQEALKDAREND